MQQRLSDILFERSPYLEFDASAHQPDLQGWGSDHRIFERVISVTKPSLIVEVGSWKGRSAINMARVARRLSHKCEIVCVDTWLGSPEHWLKTKPDWYQSLKIQNGFPQLYYTFLANVVNDKQQDIITPFPSTSENAAVILTKLGIKIDFCYIDAAHEYKPVMRDLEMYWDLLADDGVLVGDDYQSWGDVTRAADDFAKSKNIVLQGEKPKFVLRKGKWQNEDFLGQTPQR